MTQWAVRLTRQAEQDFTDIVRWTAQHFGALQAQRYADTLGQALQALTAGPDLPDIKKRDEIAPGIRTLHVARHARKGRHFVVLRVAASDTLDVLRILHDSMDLARHVDAASTDMEN
ncbi:MAG: type II toxin-antitoxin system RelE/ParE family toxin [Zoogloeaceae bacterium]|jgi:toxin ParE1/3/4|nr:type II toxin-antitoxin system RelE/ParE family toxin [Zoogloeaceae bacterium]